MYTAQIDAQLPRSDRTEPVTEGWSAAVLFQNTEGKLVGRQRKPKPFIYEFHAVDSAEAAFAIQEQVHAVVTGRCQVRFNNDTAFGIPGQPGNAEYAAVVAKNRPRQIPGTPRHA